MFYVPVKGPTNHCDKNYTCGRTDSLLSSIKHGYERRAMICTSFHDLVLSQGDKLLSLYLSCRSRHYTSRKSPGQSAEV